MQIENGIYIFCFVYKKCLEDLPINLGGKLTWTVTLLCVSSYMCHQTVCFNKMAMVKVYTKCIVGMFYM